MKKIKYPELVGEMAKRGETQKFIAKLLELDVSSVSRRLSGEIEWSIGEIDKLCEHFKKDYYELFKRNND
jgi:predicted transcriptional regulator